MCLQVKPLLNVARTEDELRQKEEELNKLREKVQRDEVNRKEIEEQQTQLMEEKNNLFIQLQRVSNKIAEGIFMPFYTSQAKNLARFAESIYYLR